MEFDLNPAGEEVSEIRERYRGRHPPHDQLLGATEKLQDILEEKAPAVGNITNYRGAHTTDTRRPLSASIDLVFDELEPEKIDADLPGWKYAGSYFFDFEHPEDSGNHLEVALIDLNDFAPFRFDRSIIDDSYIEELETDSSRYEIRLAEPAESISSKFNRLNDSAKGQSEVYKGSDSIDMASHLHWGYRTGKMDLEDLAGKVDERVEPPYSPGIDSAAASRGNFSKVDREYLRDAITEFSDLLGVER